MVLAVACSGEVGTWVEGGGEALCGPSVARREAMCCAHCEECAVGRRTLSSPPLTGATDERRRRWTGTADLPRRPSTRAGAGQCRGRGVSGGEVAEPRSASHTVSGTRSPLPHSAFPLSAHSPCARGEGAHRPQSTSEAREEAAVPVLLSSPVVVPSSSPRPPRSRARLSPTQLCPIPRQDSRLRSLDPAPPRHRCGCARVSCADLVPLCCAAWVRLCDEDVRREGSVRARPADPRLPTFEAETGPEGGDEARLCTPPS